MLAAADGRDPVRALRQAGHDHDAGERLAVLVVGHHAEAPVPRPPEPGDLQRVGAVEEEAASRIGVGVGLIEEIADDAGVVLQHAVPPVAARPRRPGRGSAHAQQQGRREPLLHRQLDAFVQDLVVRHVGEQVAILAEARRLAGEDRERPIVGGAVVVDRRVVDEGRVVVGGGHAGVDGLDEAGRAPMHSREPDPPAGSGTRVEAGDDAGGLRRSQRAVDRGVRAARPDEGDEGPLLRGLVAPVPVVVPAIDASLRAGGIAPEQVPQGKARMHLLPSPEHAHRGHRLPARGDARRQRRPRDAPSAGLSGRAPHREAQSAFHRQRAAEGQPVIGEERDVAGVRAGLGSGEPEVPQPRGKRSHPLRGQAAGGGARGAPGRGGLLDGDTQRRARSSRRISVDRATPRR